MVLVGVTAILRTVLGAAMPALTTT